MKLVLILLLCCGIVTGGLAVAGEDGKPAVALQKSAAKLPPGVSEDMFSPPPVPQFMLEKTPQPLPVDEVLRQLHEAESRANAGRSGATAVGNAANPSTVQ
jgi:hypothetical protein